MELDFILTRANEQQVRKLAEAIMHQVSNHTRRYDLVTASFDEWTKNANTLPELQYLLLGWYDFRSMWRGPNEQQFAHYFRQQNQAYLLGDDNGAIRYVEHFMLRCCSYWERSCWRI